MLAPPATVHAPRAAPLASARERRALLRRVARAWAAASALCARERLEEEVAVWRRRAAQLALHVLAVSRPPSVPPRFAAPPAGARVTSGELTPTGACGAGGGNWPSQHVRLA